MPELRPGVFAEIMARVVAEAHVRNAAALKVVALSATTQAKINASTGAHPFGTPTPARPGTGPAIISGTLVRSIDHTPVTAHAMGLQVRVGVRSGMYPVYKVGRQGRGHAPRVPSSVYARYLEVTGVRSGNRFPFLLPAFRIVRISGHVVFRATYTAVWPRVG